MSVHLTMMTTHKNRLKLSYSICFRMHQKCPQSMHFLKIFRGENPPGPPSKRPVQNSFRPVQPILIENTALHIFAKVHHILSCTCLSYLCLNASFDCSVLVEKNCPDDSNE